MKKETVESFMERIFVDFPTDKVSVWNSKWEKDNFKPVKEMWSVQTTKNYLGWLEDGED